jgi:Gram-negative porin
MLKLPREQAPVGISGALRRLVGGSLALGSMLAVASAAQAQAPALQFQRGGLDVALRGGVSLQAARVLKDEAGRTRSDADYDAYARLILEWTSASGVTLGASLEQTNRKRESEALQAGEAYVFATTPVGRFEVGRQDGGADQASVRAPVIALGQIRGDFSRYAGQQALLTAPDTSDAFKAIYLSPPVQGFRIAASWAPKFKRNAGAANPTSRTIVDDALELGLQYQRPLGDWVMSASAGYVHGDAAPETRRADLKAWSLGAEARRGPLRIGASYVDRGDSNRLVRGFDQWELGGGAAWVEDRWGVSMSAAWAEASTQTNTSVGIGGFYALTDNFQLRADLVAFRENSPTARAADGVVAVTELSFAF